MIKKKKVLIALAVLAGSMSFANGAMAAGNYWVGTTGNVWSTEQSDAKLTGMDLTLTASTTDKNGGDWKTNITHFIAGYGDGAGEINGNKLTVNVAGTGKFTADATYYFYAGDGTDEGSADASNNSLIFTAESVNKEIALLAARAGHDANYNVLEVSDSLFTYKVNMRGAQSGNEASHNTITLTNSDFIDVAGNISVLGGNGKAKANYNEVNVKSTSFENIKGNIVIYAAQATTGETSNNKLTIDNGVSFENITGNITLIAGNGNTKANNNEMNLKGTSFDGVTGSVAICIAQANATTGEASNNTAIYDNLTFTDVGKVIMQGAYGKTKADKTTITVMNSTFGGDTIIYSSDTNDGVASDGVVTVQDSSFSGKADIYGSFAENLGTATGGKVTVNGTSFAGETNICGNKTDDYGSTASNGKVTVQDSSFTIADGKTTEIYGSYMGNDTDGVGTADGSVTVENATFDGAGKLNIYGSFSEFGDVFGSNVTVEGGQYGVETKIYGNFTTSGNISEGNVVVNGVHFSAKADIYGSYDNNSYDGGVTASKGCITVTDSVFDGKTVIVGSWSDAKVNAIASNGKVTITGSEFKGDDTIIAGSYTAGNATGSEVTINGAYFHGDPVATGDKVYIYGGMGPASASGNKVTINDISFSGIEDCYIFAGASGSDISNNAITINGGDFTSVKSLNILVGSGDNATMSNNTITINGGKFSSDTSKRFYIYAGDSGVGTGTGNVLNINTCVDGIVEEICNPQTINFKAPSGMDTELPMLKVRKAVALNGVTVGADLNGLSLAADDFITLIDNVDKTDYTPANGHYQVLTVDDAHYFLVYSGGTDKITTVKPDVVVVDADSKSYNSGKSKGVYYDVFNGTDLTDKITGNTMTVDRGTFKNSVYGAGAIKNEGTDHKVSKNTVNVNGGTFEFVDGMFVAAGYGKATGTAVIAVGGDSADDGNKLNISGGKFTGSKADIKLIGGMLENNINNGSGVSLNVNNNTLSVSGGAFDVAEGKTISLYGAYLTGGTSVLNVNTKNNTVVFGAEDTTISVTEDVQINIFGAYNDNAGNMINSAQNNTIFILGDTDKAASVTLTGVYFTDGQMGTSAKDNVVNIGKDDGSTVFKNIEFKSINAVSGTGTVTNDRSGNILNVNSKIAVTGDVGGFQIINFTLPAGFGESDVMLTVGGTMNFDEGEGNTTIGINALTDGFVAVKGATVTLISANDFKGNYTSGLGTLELKDKKLCLKLLDGNISAKDLTVDARVNKGDTIILTGDGEDNILSKTISGEGGMTIDGNVSADADNIKTTGTNTVNSGKTLTLTGDGTGSDTLTVAIGGAGNLTINGNVSTNAGNIGTTGTNTVNEGKTLTITGGALTQTIGGAGNLTINGDVSTDADNIKTAGTNTVNNGKTLTLTGDGKGDDTLTVAVGGAGNLTINGDVSADADNIKTDGTNTVNSGKKLTITEGSLTIDITNNGAVDMKTGSSFGTGGKITGGAVNLNTDVKFDKGNLADTATLTLNDAVYNFSATLSGTGIAVDQIDATNISGTLSLGKITLSGTDLTAGTYYQASYTTSTPASLTVNGTSAVTYNNSQTYIFSQGYIEPGNTGSGVKAGAVDVFVVDKVYTLKEIINGSTVAVFDPAKIDTYVMQGDYTADDDLGTLGRVAGASARTLTIDGGGTAKLLGNGKAGITVNSGDTLTLRDIAEVSGWNTYAVDNSGTVNFAGDVTLGTDAVMQGAGTYINRGTLTTNALNLQMTGLTNNGTLILNDGTLNVTVGGVGSIVFDTDMSVSAAKLDNTGTNTVNKDKTLTITDGSLAQTIGGAGNLTIDGNVSADADNIKTAGTNMVNSGKTLTLTGDGKGDDTLTVAIGGDGNLTINGDVSADADNIKTAGTNTVNEGKTLTITGGALTQTIGGAGNLTINGNVSANADNIGTTGTNTVNEGKTLTITGGTLTQTIGGAGSIAFDADMSVSATKLVNTGTNTVNKDKTLTITDGSLTQTIGGAGSIVFDTDMSVSATKLVNTGTNTVNEDKTLTITDGTLTQTIGGAGNLTINGDVSADADNIKTTGTNTVNSGKTLTITGGALTQAIGGAGSIAFDADMSVSAAKLTNSGTNTVNVGKTLTITDGALIQAIGGAGSIVFDTDMSVSATKLVNTGTNTVNGGKTLTITDGSLAQTIGGAGNLTINGNVSANADNIKTTGTNTVNSGNTLTITEGSLTANITNNGAVDIKTGSAFGTGGKITGGDVTLGSDVSFAKDNLENVSLSLDNAVYSIAGALSDNDGITLEKLNVASASGTIVLGDIVLTGENFDSWADGEYKQIQFVTATDSNTLGVTNSKIVTIGDSTYTFGQAYLTAGDSASGLKFGFLEILKEIEGGGDTRTLQEMLDQETGDVKYVLKTDETVEGTLQLRDIAGSVPRTLTLKGKGNSIIAGNGNSIFKNNNADTLALENIGVKNFDTAVENKTKNGIINLKSVTFTGTKTMDVVNDGTLNILDDKVNFAKGVSGTGTMNIKDNLTLNAGAGIEQNTINVDAGKILTNKGTITINNGSLNGDGTVSLTDAGTVIINNGNLNTMVTGGILEFDGESSVEKAEYIAGNTNRVRSQAKLKLANDVESELRAILEGDGEVIIDSAIDATGTTKGGIRTRVTINKDKSLTIYADKLGNVTTNNGTLNLKGGAGEDGRTLSYAVSGAGKTVITGGSSGAEWTVTAGAPITNSGGITVDQYNVLKADIANLGCEVVNNGIVKLLGGTVDNPAVVKNNINGGTVDVIGGVFDMTNIATVQNVNTLQLTDGNITMNAEDLLDNGTTPTKTAFGSKFEGKGGFLNLNNFGGADSYTAEQYNSISTALTLEKTMLVLSGNLEKAADETVVVQGNVDDIDGTVILGDVKPKVVKKTTPTGGTVVAALPAEYVGVTKSNSADLLATDKIIVSDQSKFVAKGFQIDKLKDTAKGVLDLEITGEGTELTLVGGDKETGVVNNSTQEKIPVKLAVTNKAVFNAGLAASGDKNELIFSDILIDNAKMNVVGNNIATPKLTIKRNGWLVVDPTYMKTDELEILGGAIQVVTDGAVFNQGYDANQLKDFVERAGVGTTVKGDGFIVGNGIGIMALKNSVGHTNVTINKTAGDHLSITADPTYNPATAPMLRLDKGALLILEGSKAQDSSVPGIIDLQGSTAADVSISNDAKVFVAGANAQGVGIYKLLHGDGVNPAENYFGGNIYTDNTLYKIALLLPEERIENTFGFKLTWNEANTIFSAENLGVTRGAHDVINMVTDAVATHFGNKEEGEKLWATFIHNKNKVDGLAIGDSQAKYDEQFNGTVIGYDLVDDKDITLGLALGYVNGNTTNGIGRNDSKYNSFEVYGRKKVGAVQLHGDITYLHGKNETEMTVDGTSIKADAKTNTYSVGVRAEVPYKVGKGTLTPFAGLRYIRINGKDYSNNLGMEFSTNNLSSVVLPVGVSYKTSVDKFYGWKMKPEVAVGYAFNLGNRDSRTNVTHERIGSSYEFDVLDKGAFFIKAGISVSKKNFTVGVGYDYMKSSNSRNNRWNVNLSFSF